MTEPRDLVLPTGYTDLLSELKNRVRTARTTAVRTVNTQLIELYWTIGNAVRTQQERQSWGSGVIKRLAEDLRAEFPEMKGLSPRNLQYMTTFANAWPRSSIAQQSVAQLPWGHITVLQLSVEPQFRGRVLALYLAVLQGGTALGAPLMGWVGTAFGARWSVAGGGTIVLLTGLCSVIVVCRNSTVTFREQLRAAFVRKRSRNEWTQDPEAAGQTQGI